MLTLKACILLFILTFSFHSQTLEEVDFLMGSVYTGTYMWENFIGLSIEYDNIQSVWNNSLFQNYQLNALLRGDWENAWAISLKTPLGHKYNCTALSANITNPNVTCKFQTVGNTTYWSILGEYVWNTVPQPNWCITYDMQGVNLELTSHQDTFFSWLFAVYKATHYSLFCNELVDYGDKMVQRGYKNSYTSADFVNDIDMANYVTYSIAHSGPGATDEASKDWLTANEAFYQVSYTGHYTVRCVVFPDPTQVTIEAILSDNATKYYLRERFRVNQSFAYSDFSNLWLGINDIKLTTGDGIDGITNTFASALWALDIIIEFALMSGWEIDFNHVVRQGNFQSILGPAPDFKPSPIYYAFMLVTIIRNNAPEIVLPSTRAMISSKIKAYGFSDGVTFRILLINKDTNTSLNGKVLIRSELNSVLKCFYMEAPSLEEKENITIGGYRFIGGDASVQGQFATSKVTYNFGANGYEIPIKYAQAVLCETADVKYKWPTNDPKLFGENLVSCLVLACLALFITLSF